MITNMIMLMKMMMDLMVMVGIDINGRNPK